MHYHSSTWVDPGHGRIRRGQSILQICHTLIQIIRDVSINLIGKYIKRMIPVGVYRYRFSKGVNRYTMVHRSKNRRQRFAAGWLSTSRLVGMGETSETESRSGQGAEVHGEARPIRS